MEGNSIRSGGKEQKGDGGFEDGNSQDRTPHGFIPYHYFRFIFCDIYIRAGQLKGIVFNSNWGSYSDSVPLLVHRNIFHSDFEHFCQYVYSFF